MSLSTLPTYKQPPSRAYNPPADAEELDLIRSVAAADHAAFEMLYRCYKPRLASFLRPLLRDDALIDEAINEAMLAVWQQASRFMPKVRLSTWIFAIARNKALKALSQSVRQQRDAPVEATPPGTPHDPEQQLTHQERDQLVAGALDTLPPHLRVVVHERYFESCSYQEIASHIGCSTATVRTRMQHAHRRLAPYLRRTVSTFGN